jgi:hypothetical protein
MIQGRKCMDYLTNELIKALRVQLFSDRADASLAGLPLLQLVVKLLLYARSGHNRASPILLEKGTHAFVGIVFTRYLHPLCNSIQLLFTRPAQQEAALQSYAALSVLTCIRTQQSWRSSSTHLQVDNIEPRCRSAGHVLHPQLSIVRPLSRRQDRVQYVLSLRCLPLNVLGCNSVSAPSLLALCCAHEDRIVVLYQRIVRRSVHPDSCCCCARSIRR